MEETRTHRPVVGLVRLHGDGGALALREVVRVVDVLEAARPNDGVDVRPDLQPPRQNHIEIRKQVPYAREGGKERLERTYPARVHDRVEACRNDGPTASEDPVFRVCGRHERGNRQEFGEHREGVVKTVPAQINDCVEVRLKESGCPLRATARAQERGGGDEGEGEGEGEGGGGRGGREDEAAEGVWEVAFGNELYFISVQYRPREE